MEGQMSEGLALLSSLWCWAIGFAMGVMTVARSRRPPDQES